MPAQRVSFQNSNGISLSGIVDRPDPADGPVKQVAVFAHCFTCTKDLKAIVKISRALAKAGVAVLRFDFMGLGGSQGEFSESNFQTNLQDLRAAVEWMRQTEGRVDFLIGHSLGGAAAMALVMQLDDVKAVATLAAPSDTVHLADVLQRLNPEIESAGIGDVVIGGITHTVKKQMLDVLRAYNLRAEIEAISKPHLILHSPTDMTVNYKHALNLLAWTAGPKSLITLNGSDHLLINQKEDAQDVASMIAVWAGQWCR